MTIEEMQKIDDERKQASYNAIACKEAYELIKKYDLENYGDSKEFVLSLLEKEADKEQLRSDKLYEKLFPKNKSNP